MLLVHSDGNEATAGGCGFQEKARNEKMINPVAALVYKQTMDVRPSPPGPRASHQRCLGQTRIKRTFTEAFYAKMQSDRQHGRHFSQTNGTDCHSMSLIHHQSTSLRTACVKHGKRN